MEVVGRAWICQLYDLECCFSSHSLKWPVGVVFIATNHLLAVGEGCYRWAHRTIRCATGHCPVRQPCHPTVRVLTQSTVGALTSGGTGQSGAAPDSHCSLTDAPLTSALTSAANCSAVRGTVQSTVARRSRCSASSSDSPVAHRTVQ
jgi:hypothetical protein